MSLSIVNNTASLSAQNSLNNTNNALNTSLQRLSTGLKINSGADGPAAYVIGQQQSAQIAGLNTAIDNTNQAVSVVQTASGGLGEISSLLTQIRGLALNSANSGVNNSTALAANQAQINNAIATINSIAQTTTLDGKNLLDGSAAITGTADTANTLGLGNIQAGQNAAAGTYAVNITTAGTGGTVTGAASDGSSLATSGTLTLTGGGLTNGLTVSLSAGDNVNTAATKIQQALNSSTSDGGGAGKFAVSVTGGKITIASNVLGSSKVTVSSDSAATKNATGFATGAGTAGTDGVALAATVSYNGGAAVNAAVSAGSGGLNNQISFGGADGLNFGVNVSGGTSATGTTNVTVANNSLVFQIGANANQTASIAIANAQASALGTGVSGLNNANTTSLAAIDVTTQAGAQDAIQVVDQAISQVSSQSGTLGAFQVNTLQANATNLQNALTNTTSANQTTTNTDFSSEIANFTRLQTQLQAGATVLGNANQTTQLIAKLLQG
jgi:flagellin